MRADVANGDLEEVKRLASNKDIIHRKIQLWTNNEENEYAIRLLLDGDPESETRERKVEESSLHQQIPLDNILIL